MVYYIGIDVGKGGAIAIYNSTLGSWTVHDTPCLTVVTKSTKKTKRVLDENGFINILRPYQYDSVCGIEDQHSFPGQGVASSFDFGDTFGCSRMALTALGIPYTRISPVRWKKVMLPDMGKEKEAAVLRACQLFPCLVDTFVTTHNSKRVIKDGRAEAVLIAEYMRRGSS